MLDQIHQGANCTAHGASKPGASLRILPLRLVSSRIQREWLEPSGGDRLNLCSEALALCAVRPWSGRLMPLKAACDPTAFTIRSLSSILPTESTMADQIVITEKSSQAKDVRAAVGSRYGAILPAEGHLFDLLEPEDVVPEWKRWSPILLRPKGLYGTRPAEGGNKAAKLRAIREALRTAKRVWLATDCDREGQLIGQEILEHYEYRGQVMRVLFTAQDSQTIRDAFGRAKPNSEYFRLYAAAVARRQADQIYNLSLTRTATVILGQGARRVIGVGRVKTPTLAIVCKRELEIRKFVPIAYFEVVATAKVAGGQFQMRHAPQDRIVRRERAQDVVHAAKDFEGALTVRVDDKRQGPPKLHDLPSLQKLCGSRFGWPASKTLEVAQELYDGQGKKIITYPRAEVRYLPQGLISDVPKIVAGLQVGQSFNAIPVPDPPVIRKGASGSFYDKGLEGASHHAVIPNVNTIDKLREVWPRLSSDEKKLFDVIARAYLAALMPDFRYRQTTATLDVRGFEFRAAGRQPIDLGWRAAFPEWQPADEKGDEAQLLPPLRNGETAQLQDPKIEDKETRPPPRYNEGTLIEAMQNAWRFVDDEVLRERLRESKGIGTPATRAEIIGTSCRPRLACRCSASSNRPIRFWSIRASRRSLNACSTMWLWESRRWSARLMPCAMSPSALSASSRTAPPSEEPPCLVLQSVTAPQRIRQRLR